METHFTASGTAAGGALIQTAYKSITAATIYKVFSKAGANATSLVMVSTYPMQM